MRPTVGKAQQRIRIEQLRANRLEVEKINKDTSNYSQRLQNMDIRNYLKKS